MEIFWNKKVKKFLKKKMSCPPELSSWRCFAFYISDVSLSGILNSSFASLILKTFMLKFSKLQFSKKGSFTQHSPSVRKIEAFQ